MKFRWSEKEELHISSQLFDHSNSKRYLPQYATLKASSFLPEFRLWCSHWIIDTKHKHTRESIEYSGLVILSPNNDNYRSLRCSLIFFYFMWTRYVT